MKAIVMAGGEGTRLRPLTSVCPKPMVKIFDKPVLQHIITLLKANGITDICITLRYLPNVITDYFGDGSDLGVNLSYSVETAPLGTAGGVKKCSGFIGNDDFLIISGDCVCNFDLRSCIKFHKKNSALATIVLTPGEKPLEYGLVVTDDHGKILKFIEKPSWDKVVTNLINTGVYVMSPKALELIPDGVPYDFGKDFFPAALGSSKLYGYTAEGYWCDIGSIPSYIQCYHQCLEGHTGLTPDAKPLKSGVYSLSHIPENVKIVPPVYIGSGVIIGENSEIGPFSAVHSGSKIGRGAKVSGAIIDSAFIGENARLNDCIVLKDALVGQNSSVGEGAAIGSGTTVGAGSEIFPKVKIWPDRDVPANSKVRENITYGVMKTDISFGPDSTVSGEFNVSLTPQDGIAIGMAASAFGRVCAGSTGGAAGAVADAILCGAMCAGSDVAYIDSPFQSCAAYIGQSLGFDITVFVKENDGNIYVSFYDKWGLPIKRDVQRKIENDISGGQQHYSKTAGGKDYINGCGTFYVMSAMRSWSGPVNKTAEKVSVIGHGRENRLLKCVLTGMGLQIVSPQLGVPGFAVCDGGFGLKIMDEEGLEISPRRALVIGTLLEIENGAGKIAVPYDAPDIIEKISGKCKILRVERDGKSAEKLYAENISLRDGIFLAVKILGGMAKSSESLASINSRVPDFSSASRQVFINCDRAFLMAQITKSLGTEAAVEFDSGLKITGGSGTAYVAPSFNQQAINIRAESGSMEAAEAICDAIENIARKKSSRKDSEKI